MNTDLTVKPPLTLGSPSLDTPKETETGTTSSGFTVIPLDSPADMSGARLFFQGMDESYLQPKVSLSERVAFPLKASIRRMSNAITVGAVSGGIVTGTLGAGVGGLVGAAAGLNLGGLAKLTKMAGQQPGAFRLGAMLGAVVGGVVGGLGTAIPGAVIGAMGMAVAQLVKGFFCLPFDLYHACTADKLELPPDFLSKTLKFTKKTAAEICGMMKILCKPMKITEALKELGVEAKNLDEQTLRTAYQKCSRQAQPDKGCSDAAFQRVKDANEILSSALELSMSLDKLIEVQENMRKS